MMSSYSSPVDGTMVRTTPIRVNPAFYATLWEARFLLSVLISRPLSPSA